jgi:hypothetical protein
MGEPSRVQIATNPKKSVLAGLHVKSPPLTFQLGKRVTEKSDEIRMAFKPPPMSMNQEIRPSCHYPCQAWVLRGPISDLSEGPSRKPRMECGGEKRKNSVYARPIFQWAKLPLRLAALVKYPHPSHKSQGPF